MEQHKHAFLISPNADRKMYYSDFYTFLNSAFSYSNPDDMINKLFDTSINTGKIYSHPIEILTDMINCTEFKDLYRNCEYKLSVIKFDIRKTKCSIFPKDENGKYLDKEVVYCLYEFVIIYSSEIDNDGYKWTAIDLLNNHECRNIQHIYDVYIPEWDIKVDILTKDNNFTAVDLVEYAIEGSYMKDDIADELIESGLLTSTYDKKYTIVYIPFNRSQPALKGDISGKCIIKGTYDIKDIDIVITEIYNKGDYNA